MRRDESSDESTVISSQTSTLTRNRGPESMTGAECNVDCGDNSASEDEESREPLNQIVEEDSFEDYIPEEDIVLEEEFLHPTTAEKETNTECNFCPEGARQLHRRKSQQVSASPAEPLATIKRSQTFSPQPQSIAKAQYICRLNRSESDSSMAVYARRVTSRPPPAAGIPFDRSVRERRSLRWGRSVHAGSGGGRGAGWRRSRTSLDLALDLRAQHSRLHDLRTDIANLTALKKRLEEAYTRGDPAVAAWVAEDETLRRLVTGGAQPGDRAARLLSRTCREIYRLRKSRQGGRKPDLVTFKEKMAFFTRTKSTIPLLPGEDGDEILSEDDWEEDLEERRTPDGRSSKTSYELRRDIQTASQETAEVVECKNPCLNTLTTLDTLDTLGTLDPAFEGQEAKDDAKTDEVRYEFVVDRVLGVQV
ncbi:unnamed protein product [Chrysodeixis includens]|uniref:Uncharacterized protein n=1 Tax=Chrysodeixis includens TaxID=689277 RepID=A0A9P0BV40_CHRIL|nr:unnamed protein product [Chrysodeixis includens]